MAAENAPIPDLVELSGITQFTSFSVSPGGGGDILGVVDNATYSDDDASNDPQNVEELNNSDGANSGRLTIDGTEYNISLVEPDSPVSYTTTDPDGNTTSDSTSDIVFIVAEPIGGGQSRTFALFDDSVGDIGALTALETGELDYSVPGGDTSISASEDNDVRRAACFADGTRIATPTGELPIEYLTPGDVVLTLDHGAQTIRWIGTVQFDVGAFFAISAQAPVVIRRGALGQNEPVRDLTVSPQHRVLLRSRVANRMFGTEEILVPAIKLVGMPGIERARRASITYRHILLDRHEILIADGAPAESLLTGPQALAALANYDGPERKMLRTCRAGFATMTPARPLRERMRDLQPLLARHVRNCRPLRETPA